MIAGFLLWCLFDVLMGVAAYSTPTWNFSRTEVLRGWDNVVQVSLIWVPIGSLVLLAVVSAALLLIGWALRD